MPRWDLLRATGPRSELALRELARRHPRAQEAAHVSRSYRSPLAIVAWHELPLGVDLEQVQRLGRQFARSICTPSELARESLTAQFDDDRLVASLWSSKEALSKALGDAVDYDPRRLDTPLLWPDGVCGRWRARQLEVPDGYVAWIVWSD